MTISNYFRTAKTYFSPKDEWFLNVLITSGFICLIYEVLTKSSINLIPDTHNQLITNIFLLNGVHLLGPFLFLGLFSSGQRFLKEKLKTKKQMAILVASVLGILALSLLSESNLNYEWKGLFFKIFWLTVPMIHAVRQAWGISMLMTKSTSLENKTERAISFERFAMNIYSLLFIFVMIPKGFPALLPIQPFFVGGTFLLTLVLIIYFYRNKYFRDSCKLFFMLRLLLWPFFPLSSVVAAILSFSHGYEYIALLKRSYKVDLPRIRLGLFVVIFFWAYVVGVEFFRFSFKEHNHWTYIVMGSYTFITISHYLLDGMLYRFKDKVVRDVMSSRLIGFYSTKVKVL